MKEISKERAEELDAAWNAATDTQRLSMNRMSWFGADTVTYYEETPSKLELKAAARIEKIERIASCLLDHYLNCYDGNKDALCIEAERLIPNWRERISEWKPELGG